MRHRLSAERKPQAPSARLRMRKWPAWPAIGSKGSRAWRGAGFGRLRRVSSSVYQAAAPALPIAFDLGRGDRDVPSPPAAASALLRR